jgi:hypothetical protein
LRFRHAEPFTATYRKTEMMESEPMLAKRRKTGSAGRWPVWLAIAVVGLLYAAQGGAEPGSPPEPEPPRLSLPESDALPRTLPRGLTPTIEWAYHKTADNAHPDGNEQQMVWLANRARANPNREGMWLAETDDFYIAAGRSYWEVDLDLLKSEFDGIAARPPAAFDVRLYQAAREHSAYLIASDEQSHTGQFNRVLEAGFHYSQIAGIVFSYAETALHAHGAFNIDWGPDGGDGSGMQPGRGHRLAIMSVDGDYTNVGYAAVTELNASTSVGPLVITGNFGKADPWAVDHFNRFLVGTVWRDMNRNSRYDPGEGIGGVTVMPDDGNYYAVTADAGGYALPIDAEGGYDVTFSGSNVDPPVARRVSIKQTSVLLDLEYTPTSNQPTVNTHAASAVTLTSAILNGSVVTNGLVTTYRFEFGKSIAYGQSTPARSTRSDSSVSETLSGLEPNTTYHYRLTATNNEGTSYGPDAVFFTSNSSSGGSQSSSGGGGGGGGCFIGAGGRNRMPAAVFALALSTAAMLLLGRIRPRRNPFAYFRSGVGLSTCRPGGWWRRGKHNEYFRTWM